MLSPPSHLLRAWIPPLAWAILIFFASSRPVPVEGPQFIPHLDKLAHFLIYAAMALLLFRACFRFHRWPHARAALAAFALATLYGLTDELHQYFVPSREADFWDLAADALGAAAASVWIYGRAAAGRPLSASTDFLLGPRPTTGEPTP